MYLAQVIFRTISLMTVVIFATIEELKWVPTWTG